MSQASTFADGLRAAWRREMWTVQTYQALAACKASERGAMCSSWLRTNEIMLHVGRRASENWKLNCRHILISESG